MTTGGVPIHPAREPLPTRVEGLPDLPIEYGHVLDAGLAELDLALDARGPAPRSTIRPDSSSPGPRAINLTAIREPAAIARAHVLDSLTACVELRRRGVDTFLDLGSGAGYPGVPLAAALPAARAALVEPVGKKAAFLGTVRRRPPASPTVEVLPVRGGGARGRRGPSRSMAGGHRARRRQPRRTSSSCAFPLLVPGGVLVAWKRGDLVAEVAAAQRAIEALGGGAIDSVEPHVAGLEGHRLVVVTSRGRVPAGVSARSRGAQAAAVVSGPLLG